MFNKYQAIFNSGNLLAPSGGVLAVYALGTGTIKTVRVKVAEANVSGATVFNLSKNGADLFTTELTVPSGQTSVSVTALSFAVAFGDLLVLKLTSISAGGVIAPVALQFESEELLILSAADLVQLKTDLNLSGTNSGDETLATIKTKLGITTLSGSNTGDQDLSGLQPSDADLTAIAALVPSNDDILQRKGGVWTNRTLPQLKTDLSLSGTNSGDQTLSDATISTSDITTNNATAAKHGFLKKLSNNAAEYMDGTGSWSTPAGSGGSTLAVTTVSVTTGSLANLGNETGTINLGKAFILLAVEGDRECRVRIYLTSTYRTADNARAVGTAPAGEHGLISEDIPYTGNLKLDISPGVQGYDGAGTPTGAICYNIQNRSGATHSVTVTFTIIQLIS